MGPIDEMPLHQPERPSVKRLPWQEMRPSVEPVKSPAFGPDVEVTCTVEVVQGVFEPEVIVTHTAVAQTVVVMPWSEIQLSAAGHGVMLEMAKKRGLAHLCRVFHRPVLDWITSLREHVMKIRSAGDPWLAGSLAMNLWNDAKELKDKLSGN